MASLEVGKVQIYTGDGKGKTTAALGLALRYLLACELQNLCSAGLGRVAVGLYDAQTQTGRGIVFGAVQLLGKLKHEHVKSIARGAQVDVLILDELGEAMRRGFVTREDMEALIAIKPATTELVLTCRGLLPLADLADLVTEMRPVKHYFDEGLLARQGIEY